MHRRPRLRWPSASMVVALIALFVALGGASYAAISLPAGSVGSAQLLNSSVTNHKIANGSVGNFKLAFGAVGARKIANGAVGKTQINANQVQARLGGNCLGTGMAIDSVDSAGNVQCGSTPPQEFGAVTTANVSVAGSSTQSSSTTSSSTQILSKALPGGSAYLVLAYPNVQITNVSSALQHDEVDCTLTVSPSNGASSTGSLALDIPATSAPQQPQPQSGSIPLAVAAPAAANGGTATLSCQALFPGGTTAPTVNVSGTLNAIQTANNN